MSLRFNIRSIMTGHQGLHILIGYRNSTELPVHSQRQRWLITINLIRLEAAFPPAAMTHSFKIPGPNLIISFYRATSITSMPHGLSRVALASALTIVVGKARATPVPVKIDELANTSNSASGALLAPVFSAMQRDAVFWTAIAIAVLVNIVQGAITTLIDICEAEALWTVRFRLSLYEHLWWTGIAVTLIASFGSMVVSFLAG